MNATNSTLSKLLSIIDHTDIITFPMKKNGMNATTRSGKGYSARGLFSYISTAPYTSKYRSDTKKTNFKEYKSDNLIDMVIPFDKNVLRKEFDKLKKRT